MKYKLDNGLMVNLIPKLDYNKMIFGIMVNAGSNDYLFYDCNNKLVTLPKGIAHFLEHKIFEMDNNDASLIFSKNGANVNAYTSYNETCYYFSTTKNKLKNINLMLDMIFNKSYKEKTVELEKNIIIQELNMYKDMPDLIMQNKIISNLFNNHPIKEDIGGTKETVRKTSLKDLDMFYNTFYTPNNMSIVVIGNFDLKKVKNLIDNYNYPVNKNLFTKYKVDNYLKNIKKSKLKANIELNKIGFGIKISDKLYLDKFNYIKQMVVLDTLLNLYFGESSNLYNNLLKNNIITESFYFEISLNNDANFILFTTDTNNIKLTRTKLKNAILNLKNYKIKEKDFIRIKKMMLGKFYFSLNNLENILFTNLKYSFYNVDFNDIINIFKEIEIIDLYNSLDYIDFKSITEVNVLPN